MVNNGKSKERLTGEKVPEIRLIKQSNLNDIQNKMKILIVGTGGTFFSTIGESGALSHEEESQLYSKSISEARLNSAVAVLQKECDVYELSLLSKDSSIINPNDIKHLAKSLYDNYDSFDGFVIITGTDTMQQIAPLLATFLPNFGKPAVITGAQKALVSLASDALPNLERAFFIIGTKEPDNINLFSFPGFSVVFSEEHMSPREVYKISDNRDKGFATKTRHGILSEVGNRFYKFSKEIVKGNAFNQQQLIFNNGLVLEGILPLQCAMQIPTETYMNILESTKPKGIYLDGYGAGNINYSNDDKDPYNLKPFLAEALKREIPVLIGSHVAEGIATSYEYDAGKLPMMYAGTIPTLNLTPNAAMCKLAYLLSAGVEFKDIGVQMCENLWGEIAGELIGEQLKDIREIMRKRRDMIIEMKDKK